MGIKHPFFKDFLGEVNMKKYFSFLALSLGIISSGMNYNSLHAEDLNIAVVDLKEMTENSELYKSIKALEKLVTDRFQSMQNVMKTKINDKTSAADKKKFEEATSAEINNTLKPMAESMQRIAKDMERVIMDVIKTVAEKAGKNAVLSSSSFVYMKPALNADFQKQVSDAMASNEELNKLTKEAGDLVAQYGKMEDSSAVLKRLEAQKTTNQKAPTVKK